MKEIKQGEKREQVQRQQDRIFYGKEKMGKPRHGVNKYLSDGNVKLGSGVLIKVHGYKIRNINVLKCGT
jgi:hypothetical protein